MDSLFPFSVLWCIYGQESHINVFFANGNFPFYATVVCFFY